MTLINKSDIMMMFMHNSLSFPYHISESWYVSLPTTNVAKGNDKTYISLDQRHYLSS